MLITELLDTKTSFKVLEDDADMYSVLAKIGDRFINVHCENGYKNKGVWSIEFMESETEDIDRTTHKMTGSGHAPQVFALVIDIIKQLISKHSPKIIEFSADKEDGANRAAIYKRLISRAKFPGYSLREVPSKYGLDRYVAFELFKDSQK